MNRKEEIKDILRDQISIRSTKSLDDIADDIDRLYRSKKKLRYELIKFVKWYNRDFDESMSSTKIVDEYLKTIE
jgi:hypothetical protein